MCRPSRFDLEGRSYVVTDREPGFAVDAAASAREVRAGRVVPVSPKPRANERRCEVRLANILAVRVHTAARPCGTNGRAYGKTVWSWPSSLRSSLSRRCQRAQPGGRHRQSARRGRPERIRLPGERGISRQTIAQGRPCVGLHLYAAVRSSCATHSRSGPWVPSRHPAFPAPSWTRGRSDGAKLGRIAPRGCEGVSASQNVSRRATPIPLAPSLRAQRSKPESLRGETLDCFAALAMTRWRKSCNKLRSRTDAP